MANVTGSKRCTLSKSAKNQIRKAAWGRFVLGLFAFAWLSASAAPCQMAMEFGPDTDVVAEHSGHGAHHQQNSDDNLAEDCVHCAPGADQSGNSCASILVGECGETPDTSIDKRFSPSKLKDNGYAQLVLHPPPQWSVSTVVSNCSYIPRGQVKFATGPSLSVRYCVYLK